MKMKRTYIISVKDNGVNIPKEELHGINESDLVEIQIQKLYLSKKLKKKLLSIA